MNTRALGLLALKVCGVSAFAGLTAYANEVNVADSYRVVMSDINSTLTLTPTNSANWRTVVGDPVFWFDASERDGWVLDGSDIVKIPSKVGERYLTSDWTEQGTSFTGWGSGKNICPPQLVTDGKLGNGGWVVEFGALGSMRALLFNAVARSSDGAVKNYLENIGSVVAVYNSANSGGYFLLGGGRFSGRDYIRAGDQDGGSAINYWNGLLAWVSQDQGNLLRQNFFMDDLYGITDMSGFGGNWQVIAYSPKSADAGANGLGLGRAESGYASTSGGMGIAEILIFDKVLTKDELYLVDAHLQEKWFRKGPRGWGPRVTVEHLRNSRSGSGAEDPVRTTVAVGADQTLEIGKLNGGRNGTLSLKAKLIKTGAGTVTVRDGRTFGGDIELKGGTLAFEPKRKVPASADELPYGLYVRFDPSEPACLVNTETVSGTNFIGALRNLTTHRRAKEEIFARPYNLTAGAVASTRAWLLPDDLGAGLNVVDFGLRTGNVSTKGCMYAFATNATAGARVALPQVTTVIAVVGAQRHGGSIMDSLFKRNTVWAGTVGNGDYSSQLLHKADGVGNSYKAASVYAFRDGVIWIDGEKRANTSGYPSPGYHVLALQVPAHTASYIGGNQENCYGGLRLGEMLVYNRPLKDEELRDAQAYLMRKWLGRTPGGYEDAASKAADIQSVAVRSSSGAAIDVPGDETATIERLNAPGVLAKTGEGTLEVGAGSDLSGLKLVAGDVKVRTDVPDVTAKCEIASGASLRLDATEATTIDFYPGAWQNDEGGVAEKRILNWRSVGDGVGAFQSSSTMSEHPTLMENELNGLPVVDFGPYAKQDAGTAYLMLADPLDNVRSVFAVVGSQNGGGSLLGNFGSANRGSTDFSRASSGVVLAPETPYFANARPQTKKGEIWIDGVQTDFTAAPNGGYELLELHTADGGHVSALGNDCDYYHRGGLRIGEIVIFERVLSEREKIATRNYLLKKWFAKDESELADLPEKPTIDTTVRLGEISVAAGDVRAVEADMSVLRLTGEGAVAKAGAATTLSVRDLSDFGGVLSVAAGTVALTGAPATDEPELVTDGLIAHFDAAKGVTLSENSDGSSSVASWRSQVGDWVAEPGMCYGGSVVKPNYLESELNGLPAIKLQYDGFRNNAHLRFMRGGETATLTGIRSVFWLVGSQEGGGYLLGGGLKADGVTHFSAWMRGGTTFPPGAAASDGLTHWSSADAPVINASWRLNGAPTVRSDGLTGGYDVVSMVVRDGDAATTADGFAFAGEYLTDQVNYCYHCGHQRLGEVLVYDRSLSSDEVAKVEAYLKAKWGYTQKSVTNGTTVELAADATLATTGSQYVDTLSGEGDVTGDVTVRNFIADAGSDGFSVSGTLTIAANPTVTFTNLPDEIGAQLVVPLATAAEYAGTENLGDATFVGVPDTYRARLRIRNGKLVASLRAAGTVMIVR